MLKTLIITSDKGVFHAFTVLFDRSMVCFHLETSLLAADSVRSRHPHLVLLDLATLPREPKEVIPSLVLAARATPVVALLRSMNLEAALEATRCGAADCLLLPPPNPTLAFQRLARLAAGAIVRWNNQAREQQEALSLMIGEGAAMRKLKAQIHRLAKSDASVAIEGETGSGKELVASALHRLSPRRGGPFVTRNCAAVPEQLVESDLFGVAKGAFTGAVERPGSFEEAHRGTLFLDEIGELAASAQSTLLRVTEERQIRRLGESRKRPVDVRLLAATNRPLRDQVADGRFRQDLLYRLNTLKIEVPPLRERREDVRLIASAFLDRIGGGGRLFSESALRLLESYDWPGNVRELLNVVERARLLTDDPIIGSEAISVEQ